MLWLVGACTRATMLSLPPVIPFIHRDLDLSETAIGVLTSLPVLLLALGAVPGSLLVARTGLRRTLFLGLVMVTLFGAARGLGPSETTLFASTFLMGIGVAILQPAVPALVKSWFPARIGIATAIFTNGIIVGEIFGASFTVPLMRGSWELGLAIWSLVVLSTALLSQFLVEPVGAATPSNRLWWPNWRDKAMWDIGILLGCSSALYFGANAFVPDFLHAAGADDDIGPCLTVLNVSQLIAFIPMFFGSASVVGRRLPLVVSGVVGLVAVAGIVSGLPVLVFPAAAAIGFCTAFLLALTLALPPLLAKPEDVPRLSAGIFALAYLLAVVLPIVGGAIWDLTGVKESAFAPYAVGSILVIVFALLLDLRPHPDADRWGDLP